MSKELDEALKCLEALDDIFYLVKKRKTPDGTSEEYEFHPSYTDEYKTIENYILKAQKILNILKSKKYIPLDDINPIFWFNKKIYDETVNYEYYLWLCEDKCEYVVKEENKLTKEEFNAIKEMLSNE